jgi:hypothetical protein
VPKNFCSEASLFREYLAQRKTPRTLNAIKDFRRRVWKVYLPALPLLTAIHMDCLEYNAHEGEYRVTLPGAGKRYMAISLISNPQVWVSSVVQHAEIRRLIMADHFAKNAFAEILPEDGLRAD